MGLYFGRKGPRVLTAQTRGGDSLIIALALPYAVSGGAPLPGRNAIIFITFVVILVTLVLQGFTLSPLIRLLCIVGGDEEDQEVTQARGAGALDRLEAAGGDARLVAELRQMYVPSLVGPNNETSSLAQLRLGMIAAERETVIAMRDRNEISDTVMPKLLGEFDHEEVLLSRQDN